MRATTSEKNHEEHVRKLVEMVQKEEIELEMMQKEEMEKDEQRGRVAPNMGQVAHTARPHRTRENEGKRHEGRDGQTVKTTKERRKKNRKQKEKGSKRRKKRKSKRRRERQCQKQGTRS